MHKSGNENPFTNRLCGYKGENDCDKALNSQFLKFGKNIGAGDLGLIYFSTIFIFLLLAATTESINSISTVLLIPFSIAMLFTFYSLWYQGKVLKIWCRICFLILGIIWMQGMVLYKMNPTFTLSFSGTLLFFFIFSFLVSGIWVVFKWFMIKSDEALTNRIELDRWNRNPDIFLSLLHRQKHVNFSQINSDIELGNMSATIQIVVACSPFCRPCALAHQKLEELLQIYSGEVGIIIRFLVPADNQKDHRYIAARNILNAFFHDESKIRRMKLLTDWFAWTDLEKWKKIYNYALDKPGIHTDLLFQQQWCEVNKILQTPTIFVNGYELPPNYGAHHLKLLIPLISELIAFLPGPEKQSNDARLASQW